VTRPEHGDVELTKIGGNARILLAVQPDRRLRRESRRRMNGLAAWLPTADSTSAQVAMIFRRFINVFFFGSPALYSTQPAEIFRSFLWQRPETQQAVHPMPSATCTQSQLL